MGCKCKCAPYSAFSISSRILLILLFCAGEALFSYFVFPKLFKGPKRAVICFYCILVFWIIFSVLWIWSHIVTSWLDAGSLKYELEQLGYIKDGKLQNLSPQIDSLSRCQKCSLPKPERTHHCSQCNLCYLRFDHHCPTIGNCVALYNMKSFILFQIYSGILIVLAGIGLFVLSFYTSFLVPLIIGLFGVILFVVGVVIIVYGITFLRQVCINYTTLEQIAKNPRHQYDIGCNKNIRQVFGNSVWEWFFPIRPSTSGFFWSGITDFSHPESRHQINEQTVRPPEEDDALSIQSDTDDASESFINDRENISDNNNRIDI